jgi:hypothetical protein
LPNRGCSAEADDDAAIEILNRQADEVVSFVIAAIRRLRIARLDVPVVPGCSIMTALSPRFVTRIEVGVQRVAPTARCAVCYDRAATLHVRSLLKDERIREVKL